MKKRIVLTCILLVIICCSNVLSYSDSIGSEYPDWSYLDDRKNYPMPMTKWLELRKEIYAGLEEPQDNDRGYAMLPERLFNNTEGYELNGVIFVTAYGREIRPNYLTEPYREGYLYGNANSIAPKYLNSITDYIDRIKNQKLRILDPPDYYGKTREVNVVMSFTYTGGRPLYGDLEVEIIGNKYMRISYTKNLYGAYEAAIYTYVYPAYVDLILRWISTRDPEFVEFTKTLEYGDMENAV